jgi:hypothetical protein
MLTIFGILSVGHEVLVSHNLSLVIMLLLDLRIHPIDVGRTMLCFGWHIGWVCSAFTGKEAQRCNIQAGEAKA